jgi:hypothetical protein
VDFPDRAPPVMKQILLVIALTDLLQTAFPSSFARPLYVKRILHTGGQAGTTGQNYHQKPRLCIRWGLVDQNN